MPPLQFSNPLLHTYLHYKWFWFPRRYTYVQWALQEWITELDSLSSGHMKIALWFFQTGSFTGVLEQTHNWSIIKVPHSQWHVTVEMHHVGRQFEALPRGLEDGLCSPWILGVFQQNKDLPCFNLCKVSSLSSLPPLATDVIPNPRGHHTSCVPAKGSG